MAGLAGWAITASAGVELLLGCCGSTGISFRGPSREGASSLDLEAFRHHERPRCQRLVTELGGAAVDIYRTSLGLGTRIITYVFWVSDRWGGDRKLANPEDRASYCVVWVDVDVTALSHDRRGVVDTGVAPGDSLNDSTCGLSDCIAPARVSSDSRPSDGTSHWPSAPSVVVSELRRPRTSVPCASTCGCTSAC